MKNAGIYILTSPSGKQYIGKDTHLPKRINQHLSGKCRCRAIQSAIRKYGRDTFTVKVIPYPYISKQMLSIFEQSYIAEYNTYHNGYNLTTGGDSPEMSFETRQKMSKSAKGKVRTAAHQAKLTKAIQGERHPMFGRKGEASPRYGKKHTPETRKKMSQAAKGRKLSAETKRKIGEAHKGKIFSEASRKKLSESQKRRYQRAKAQSGQLKLF